MINLFISYYDERVLERSEEIQFCIEKNIACPEIDKIFIINESNKKQFKESKVVYIDALNKRTTFSDFFVAINKYSADEDFNIIANSDIYFDHHLDYLKYLSFRDKALALSRWDVKKDGNIELFNKSYSQDCWVFKGLVKNINGDFGIGLSGCDNRLVAELKKAGYKVHNPSISIKTYHYHISDFRNPVNPSTKVERPYDWSIPDTLLPAWKNLIYYFLKPGFKGLNHNFQLIREAHHNHFAFLLRYDSEHNQRSILSTLKNQFFKYVFYDFLGKFTKKSKIILAELQDRI